MHIRLPTTCNLFVPSFFGGDNFLKKVFSQSKYSVHRRVPGILLPHIESWPGTLYWRYLVLLPNQVLFHDTILPETKIALNMDGWKMKIPFGACHFFQVLLLMIQNSQTTTWEGKKPNITIGKKY